MGRARTIFLYVFFLVLMSVSPAWSSQGATSFHRDSTHFARVFRQLGNTIQSKLTKHQPPRPVLGEFEESVSFDRRMQDWREISDSLVLSCYSSFVRTTLSGIPLELPAYSMAGKRFVLGWTLSVPDCSFRVVPFTTSITWPKSSALAAVLETPDGPNPLRWFFPGGFLLDVLSSALPEEDSAFYGDAPLKIDCVVPADQAKAWRKLCGYSAPGFEDTLQTSKQHGGAWHLDPSKLEGPEAEEFMRSFREGKAGWQETKRLWKPDGSRTVPETVTMDLDYAIRPYRISSGFLPEIQIFEARISIRDSVVMTVGQ